MSSNAIPLIVTDLDGTLLDHDSYSFAPAKPALEEIARRHYPLILNSSKTRAEMLALQKDLGLHQPFICENGAAVFLPDNGRWQQQAFAKPREEWLPWVHELRLQEDYPFLGFSDWRPEQIAEITGLPVAKATLAARREFSEPLLWQGPENQRQEFEKKLKAKQLRLVRGGRFFSLQGEFDKAQAMQWLKAHYQKQHPVFTVALGDSPNDLAMLNAADIAVIIKSAQSSAMTVEGPKQIIRTELPGPSGWQQAITTIISDLG